MAITVNGELPAGRHRQGRDPRDHRPIGIGGGIGSMFEYRGDTIAGLSMEGRMTVCNMSIEAGAKAGLIAPDDRPSPTSRAALRAEGRRVGGGAGRLAHAAHRPRRHLR